MSQTTWRPSGDVAGLTDQARLPRLGKIRLGIKKLSQRGAEYPAAVDFLVVPDVVKAVYGEKPRELDIVFPSDEVARVAGVAWKSYTASRGKVCTSDGEHAVRLVDVDKLPASPSHDDFDRAIATAESKKVEWRELDCPAKDCLFAKKSLCKPVMNLMFLLPKVPGIGVFQLDTGSVNSIIDVRGGIELVMQLSGGRLAGIPLKLRLEPMEVISPDDQKKKVVWTLKVISPATLGKVLMAGERNLRELLMADEGSGRSVGLPELTGGREVPPPQEPEDDLYPTSVITTTSHSETPETRIAGPSSAPADLEARAEELFDELGVQAKDRTVYRNAHKGRPEELVRWLEAQSAKRAKK